MIDNNKMIKVVNRFNGRVVYKVEDLGVRRAFNPREEKEISFEELKKLSYSNGGRNILKNRLVIRDIDAAKEIIPEIEPEYFYTEKEVKNLLMNGSINELLDCLDFAPLGVIDILKEIAITLPLNDVAKRTAIKNAIGFDVTKAIEIRNTKYDGDSESIQEPATNTRRRAAAPAMGGESAVDESKPQRRTTPTELPRWNAADSNK